MKIVAGGVGQGAPGRIAKCEWCGVSTDGRVVQSSPFWAKGFAISSLPSTGLTRTRRVPRATTRPKERVDSLPSSSVGWRAQLFVSFRAIADVGRGRKRLTSHHLLHVVEHEIHEGVVALEGAAD